MALNFDYITAITRDKYLPNVADNIMEDSALFAILRKDDQVIPGGLSIIQPLEYAQNTAKGTYNDYDLLDVTPPDHLTAAQFYMKNYYVSVSISGDDERENDGDEAVVNLLNSKFQNAEMSLKQLIYQDLFTGTAGIVGLDTAIDDGTYGGIAGGTYTWWQSGLDENSRSAANMKDSTNAAYIHTLLRAGYNSAKHLGKAPNLILTCQEVYDIYEQTLQSEARYPLTGTGKFLADAGFQVLEFRNIPIVVDDFCATDKMYMINTEFMKLYYHPDNNFKFTGYKVPTNQDARVGQIFFTGQLAISNRRMFYRWTTLNQ